MSINYFLLGVLYVPIEASRTGNVHEGVPRLQVARPIGSYFAQ